MNDAMPRTIHMADISTILPNGELEPIDEAAALRILQSTHCLLKDSYTREQAIEDLQRTSKDLLFVRYDENSGHKPFRQARVKLDALRDTFQKLCATAAEPSGKVALALGDLDEWLTNERKNVENRKGRKGSTRRREADKRIVNLFISFYGADQVVETSAEAKKPRSAATARFLNAFRTEMRGHLQSLISRSAPEHIGALSDLEKGWYPLAPAQQRNAIKNARKEWLAQHAKE